MSSSGISIITNFDVNSPQPIDSRSVVDTIASRDALPVPFRYIGLSTLVLDDGTGAMREYRLEGGVGNDSWVEVSGSGSSGTQGVPGTPAIATTTDQFAAPAVGSSVTIPVDYPQSFAVGSTVYVETTGYLTVTSISASSIVAVGVDIIGIGLISPGKKVVTAGRTGSKGPAGSQGATGATGPMALHRATTTSASSTPYINTTTTLQVDDSRFTAAGSVVLIQGIGFYYVTAVPSSSQVTISGYEVSSGGLAIPGGTVVINSGPRGPRGLIGAQGEAGTPGGPQGFQGDTGFDGAQGSQGPQGFQGAQGSPGPTGQSGLRGPQGYDGQRGSDGATGADGAGGATGPTGPKGDAGASFSVDSTSIQGSRESYSSEPVNFSWLDVESGLLYFKTSSGDTWSSGIQFGRGDTGESGATGPQGFQGYQGECGSTGLLGPTGPQGDQGYQGELGPQGYQGSQGGLGFQGPQGSIGATGPQGLVGPSGPMGPQGSVIGVTGPQGNDGIIYASCSGTWIVPGSGDTVAVPATNTSVFAAGMYAWIEGIGYYRVSSVATNSIALINLGLTGNASPGSMVTYAPSSPVKILQAGVPGSQGYQGLKGDVGPTGPQGLTVYPYTFTSSDFTVPEIGESATIRVELATVIGVGSTILVEGIGYFKVTAAGTGTLAATVLVSTLQAGDIATSGRKVVMTSEMGATGATGPQGEPGTAYVPHASTHQPYSDTGIVQEVSDPISAKRIGASPMPFSKTITSSSYNVSLSDWGKVLKVSAAASSSELILPPASSVPDGFYVFVVKVDSESNPVFINPTLDSGNTIAGEYSVTLTWRHQMVGVLKIDATGYTAVTPQDFSQRNATAKVRIDFGNVEPQNFKDVTVTILGVTAGVPVTVGAPSASVVQNTSFFAWATGTNTIVLRCLNNGGSTVTVPSGDFTLTALLYS